MFWKCIEIRKYLSAQIRVLLLDVWELIVWEHVEKQNKIVAL